LPASTILLLPFNDTPTTAIYTLSLHDALPIWHGNGGEVAAGRQYLAGGVRHPCDQSNAARKSPVRQRQGSRAGLAHRNRTLCGRSEEHTSELQSRGHLVCRLLLEKKKHK